MRDIRPGPEDSGVAQLTAVGNTLFFVAHDGRHGSELWKTDGTTDGSVLVKDIRPGFDGSRPSYLVAAGAWLFFAADDGVARHRALAQQRHRAGHDARRRRPAGPGKLRRGLPGVDRQLGLLLRDERERRPGAVAEQCARRRHRDGPKVGAGPEGSLPIGLTPIGDRLYFSAVDGDRQQQPWRTDGTATGTERIGTSFDPKGLAYPSGFTPFGDGVAFAARDAGGIERLWLVDAAGTVRRLGIPAP